MNNLPADHETRIRALDSSQSFICEAPAGSGKTELLTQRVLTLLAQVDKPESVVAITFTRKAAAEMRDRIVRALEAGARAEPSGQHQKTTWTLARAVLAHDHQKQWQLRQNPNRLQISTFDSLCAGLTRALPLQSSLGAAVKPSENSERLLREAARNTIDTLEQDVPWAVAVRQLMKHLDNQYQRLEDLFVRMLASRDAWMPVLKLQAPEDQVRALLQDNLQQVIEDKVVQLQELIPASLHAPLLGLAGFAGNNMKTSSSELADLAGIDLTDHLPSTDKSGVVAWQALSSLLLTGKGEWRSPRGLNKNCGFPVGDTAQDKAAYKEQKQRMATLLASLAEVEGLLGEVQAIRHWPDVSYAANQWQILQALTTVLPILVAHLQLVFRARGEVDFTEISNRARQALGEPDEPTELALRLDHTIDHILVDEFQDTSFAQVELLQKLTAGWQPDDGRTLFCVGDAMQSIYGFRNANVGLFLYCKENGLEPIPLNNLQLSTNFRSQAGLVHWVNKVFKKAFPPHSDISSGAVAYADAQAFQAESVGAAVGVRLYEERVQESALVVDLVNAARAQQADAQIAILVRNRSHATAIAASLNQAGMRYRAVDLEPLAEKGVVQDLLALCRALLCPADRIAWLAIMRAPWCGLSLADLHVIAQHNESPHQRLVLEQIDAALEALQEQRLAGETSLSQDAQSRLQRVMPILRQGLGERQRKTLRQWVEGIWISLGGPGCLQEPVELNNVERFWQLLEEVDGQGESLQALEEGVASLFAAPDPASDGSLQIMTIHKSKGLEFDVVILPGLSRQPRARDPELLLWQERLSRAGREELLLAPIGAVGADKDAIYRHLEQEQKKREQLETCRLLYVACTRAKTRLYLLAQATPIEGEAKSFKAPKKGSLIEHIWDQVATTAQWLPYQEQAESVDAGDDASPGDEAAVMVRPLHRLPADWQLPTFAEGHLLTPFIPHFEFENSEAEIRAVQQREYNLPRFTGTLVHQILQAIGEQGLSVWQGRDLTLSWPNWRARLLELGASKQDADVALPRVQKIIEQVFDHPKFHWLLNDEHQRYLEYAISSCHKDRVVNSVLDALVVDTAGEAWIVDYKISEPTEGEHLDDFVRREQRVYHKAMARYAKAVQALGYKMVHKVLFFPMVGQWAPYSD